MRSAVLCVDSRRLSWVCTVSLSFWLCAKGRCERHVPLPTARSLSLGSLPIFSSSGPLPTRWSAPRGAWAVTPSQQYRHLSWRGEGLQKIRKPPSPQRCCARSGRKSRRLGAESSGKTLPGGSRFSFPGPALLCLPLSHCLFINRRRDGGPPPWGTYRAGAVLQERERQEVSRARVAQFPRRAESADSDSRVRLAPASARSWSRCGVHLELLLAPPGGREWGGRRSGGEGDTGRKRNF